MSKRYGSITHNYLPPIKKILSILVKDSLKIEIKFFHRCFTWKLQLFSNILSMLVVYKFLCPVMSHIEYADVNRWYDWKNAIAQSIYFVSPTIWFYKGDYRDRKKVCQKRKWKFHERGGTSTKVLPVSSFIPPSSSTWNSRVNEK